MTTHNAHVIGDTGPPVVLIPGGAARSAGFFPHLERALTDYRIVLVDRQGTGTAAGRGPASLATGSAAYAEVLTSLGAGPALVVGQSLGGVMAVQFAIDHPSLVSGLVLIDPAPFNDPKMLARLCLLVRITMVPTDWPVIGPLLVRSAGLATDELARASLRQAFKDKAGALTVKAIANLPTESAALAARLRKLEVPVVIMTADRKPGHRVRLRHDEIAAALGGRTVSWPRAVHAEHWRDPQKVTDLVLSVLSELRVP